MQLDTLGPNLLPPTSSSQLNVSGEQIKGHQHKREWTRVETPIPFDRPALLVATASSPSNRSQLVLLLTTAVSPARSNLLHQGSSQCKTFSIACGWCNAWKLSR